MAVITIITVVQHLLPCVTDVALQVTLLDVAMLCCHNRGVHGPQLRGEDKQNTSVTYISPSAVHSYIFGSVNKHNSRILCDSGAFAVVYRYSSIIN